MQGPEFIANPLFLAEIRDDSVKFHIRIADHPIELFGVAISDLIDHIANAFHQSTGRDVRDVRAKIVKVLRDEDRFKEKDPKRAQMSGRIVGRTMQ
jgi:hypothetical protein